MFFTREFIRMAMRLYAFIILLNTCAVLVLAWPFAWLWNVTLVRLGVPMLSYPTALGILLLWSILRVVGPQFGGGR